MVALTRDAILARDDIARAVVECPEWGGTVTVRGLTLAERNSFKGVSEEDAALKALILCMIDAKTGKPLFSAEDIAALGEKSPAVIDRLSQKILELSGIGQDAQAAEKN